MTRDPETRHALDIIGAFIVGGSVAMLAGWGMMHGENVTWFTFINAPILAVAIWFGGCACRNLKR